VIHRLSLARAAHLAGVSRTLLQKMVRDGTLATSEGMVTTEELLRAFPQVRVVAEAGLERMTSIKEESFGRRVREHTLPSQEILAQRLFAQTRELAEMRRLLQRYHALVTEIDARVAERFAGHAAVEATRAGIADELGRLLASESVDPLAVMEDLARVMTPHVRLRPSGHEFLVEGRDTLLEAGLKAGARLAYGCGNGSCGLCKARVAAGEARRVKHHDYPLSGAERSQGHILMCAYAPVTDVELETLEASEPGDIPAQTLVATVRAVKPLASDTLLVHLQTPRSNRLRFLAGQSVTLGAALASGDVQGAYPIASCPCDDRNLHFHVGREAADELSARFFGGELGPGAALTVTGPEGRFVLGETPDRTLAFLCCDLGFAPVKSLIEYALSADAADRYAVFWLSTRDGHYLANQCRSWAEAFDDFHYAPLVHHDPADGAAITVAAASQMLSLQGCDVYVAGPDAFVGAAEFELRSSGVSAERIRTQTL
jgi:CDP-4-dehydro-6-deoxyglucose reductase, E3